ncbi:MAG: N-acetylglucosamine-6-phosphate deacetylase [Anaerolineae bacterium]|nr:N-acetylglucosamine-6-phosphate deacetylase [Anaerolineae bacterium]
MTMYSGFVDLQVNGYKGVDFSDPALTESQFLTAAEGVLASGTAAFLPTLITSPKEVYHRNIPLIASIISRQKYRGKILGIHLEGPFISAEPGAVGAHTPEHVKKPDLGFLSELLNLAQGTIKLLTIAAELPGIEELIKYAASQHITVSVGHSLFTTLTLNSAVEAGAQALTHLGNGLPNMLPRHPNPLWAGLACDDLTAMLITDGHHLPDEVIKTAVRVKGVNRLVAVSDASPVAGLPPGPYTFSNNDAILEPSGRFFNPAKQCLVGSSATLLTCMNYLASLAILPVNDLVQIGTINPLNLINMSMNEIDDKLQLCFNTKQQKFEKMA